MKTHSTFSNIVSTGFARSAAKHEFGKFYADPANAGFRDRLPHQRPGVSSNRRGPVNNRLHAALHGDAK